MNIDERTVLDRAAEALKGHGLTVLVQKEPRTARGARADAWLRLAKGDEYVDYVAEVKRAARPATVGAAITQMRHLADATNRAPLLVTDYVTPPLAERLRANRQQFADTAGNAYLEGPAFLVYVTGRKPPATATVRPNRTFTAAGLKVLFALLCNPKLAEAPYREIAVAAGVALGAIPPVLAELQQAGHVVQAGKQRRINPTKRLLDEWAFAYARVLRDKTLAATHVTPNFGAWQKWKLDPREARWGGEPAASLLVRYLKPGVLTIYAEKLPARLVVEQRMTAANPLERQNLVEVRRPFWGQTLRDEVRPDIVPMPLVYADLLATGDARCIETGQVIYEEHLAGRFRTA